jgi:hypothetical protein
MALYKAVKIAVAYKNDSAIMTDSLSSVLAIKNPESKDPLVNHIQHHLRSNPQIKLVFVHSHVGLMGNDSADEKAKEATGFDAPTISNIGVADLKRRVSSYLSEVRQRQWDELPSTNKLKSAVPRLTPRVEYLTGVRHEDTVLTRVRIGHTRMTHGYLLVSPHVVPQCDVCQVQLSVEHILTTCSKYDAIRRQLNMPTVMANLFKPQIDYSQKLLTFFREADIIDEI